jgi:hypothetical protein
LDDFTAELGGLGPLLRSSSLLLLTMLACQLFLNFSQLHLFLRSVTNIPFSHT